MVTALFAGILFAASQAVSAETKSTSLRDPLEFERTGLREPLTVADKKTLEPLWKAFCERSTEMKSVSQTLVQRGWTAERVSEFFDRVFQAQALRLSNVSSSKFGIALTIPSLEPTYPVPGGQAPAYLLPAMAKHEGRRGNSSASIGDGTRVASAMLWRPQEGQVRRALDNLCLIYQGYISRCAVFRKVEKEIQGDPSIKSTQLDRLIMLTSDRNNLRKQLVELVGENAVKKLDDDLRFQILPL